MTTHTDEHINAVKEEQKRSLTRTVIFVAACLLIMAGCAYLGTKWQQDAIDEYKPRMQAKYAAWVSYRDANCMVSEKAFGLLPPLNAHSSSRNAIIYMCTDGVKYTVDATLGERVETSTVSLDHIPDVS